MTLYIYIYIVNYILDYIQQNEDVSLGKHCAAALYPFLLSKRFSVETAVTAQCHCLIAQHVICGRLTAPNLNSALEGCKCLTSRPGLFTPAMNPCIQ
jgi:hypothetical protein